MDFDPPLDYIPISRQFPGKKEIAMDDGAKRKAPAVKVCELLH